MYFLFSIFMLLIIFARHHLLIQSFAEHEKVSGFSIDLIHRHSELSPFYNHSATLGELANYDALSSIARVNYFCSSNSVESNKIESSVIPDQEGGNYLMKISFGSPPVESLAAADTGSDLIWIQCAPCDQCYQQDAPLFDPSKSSTYLQLACDTQTCHALRAWECVPNTNACQYRYSYGDQSYTIGLLSQDTFTFQSSGGDQVPASFPKSVFGCGHNNEGIFGRDGSGLVGLGRGPLSLISQLNSEIQGKFSYCLLPRTANSFSKLRFGSEATISGEVVSTPLQSGKSDSFYYLSLEGVSVGNNKIENNQVVAGEGNIIIDSGTTLTLLESNLYGKLEASVRESIDLVPVDGPQGNYRLCYGTSFNTFPEVSVVFHFTGADATLNKLNLFRPLDDSLTCFTIIPANDLNIYGNFAQMNFQVLYDLSSKQVSFAPADCTQY